MTAAKFARRNRILAQHLERITRLQQVAEKDGVLQPQSEQFREVFSAQERLLTAVERLLEQQPQPQQQAA
jgi:hypothetical protein